MPILHSVVTKKDYDIPDGTYRQTKKDHAALVKRLFNDTPKASHNLPFNELALARHGNEYYLFELDDALGIVAAVEKFFQERGIEPCT